jgi:hypothetical protein
MNLGLHPCSLTLDWFTPGYSPATAPRLFKLEQNRPAKPDAFLVLATSSKPGQVLAYRLARKRESEVRAVRQQL